jgi:hypothetical protein
LLHLGGRPGSGVVDASDQDGRQATFNEGIKPHLVIMAAEWEAFRADLQQTLTGSLCRRPSRPAKRRCSARKETRSESVHHKVANPVVALPKLGSATAPSSKTMSKLFDGPAPNCKLMVIGVSFDPIEATIPKDTSRLAELTGVRPLIET